MTDNTSGLFLSLCFDFHLGVASGTSGCGFFANTSGDNGSVFQVLNTVDPTRSAIYAYDTLNRVSQANTENTTSANCWGESYTIDSWGNLTSRSIPSGMSGSCITEGSLGATATTNNQLSGLGMRYDAAGNVTQTTLAIRPSTTRKTGSPPSPGTPTIMMPTARAWRRPRDQRQPCIGPDRRVH